MVNKINEKNLVLTRAQGAVLARDFPTAARLYKQLLKDDPSNVDYLKELGSIYVKNNEDEKAIPYYEQIITFYPHYIDAMNSLGAIYRRLKRYEESIDILQRAVDEGRQSSDVNYNLGFTYREMGNYDDAIEAFSSVINENPNDVLAYNHLGAIYLEKKEYEKSINSFKRGLQIDQNHPILNYNLARCYGEAKKYSDAIRCYQMALRSKPGWVDAVKDFSKLLVKCQKSQEASELVKHSIELYPNDTKLLAMLGNIYLEQYDYASAEKTFKRAKKVDNQDIQILTGLADALEKGEKPQEALDNVLDALEIEPEDLDVRKLYVRTLLSADEVEAAGTNVKELYKENENDPQVLDLYGQYLICNNEEEKAERCYKMLTDKNRTYKEHLLSAANRLNQVGNTAKAEQMAKEYVARDMRNPAGYNMLGKIYSKAGNYQEAIDSYDKSRNLRKPNILADKQIDNLKTMLAQGVGVPAPAEEETDEILENDAVETVVTEVAADSQISEAEKETDSDEFDFGTMGDNVPMAEALQEEEEPFFGLKDDEEISPFNQNEEDEKSDKEKLLDGANDEIKFPGENASKSDFKAPEFTGDGQPESGKSVAEMLDDVDGDNFDFDQFDENYTADENSDEEFDIRSMPDPYGSVEKEGVETGFAGNQPEVIQMPQSGMMAQTTPAFAQPGMPSYGQAMIESASIALDTVRRSNEIAQQNAQNFDLLEEQRQEQYRQIEQKHADEMEEMRQKVAALEEENDNLMNMTMKGNPLSGSKSLMSSAEALLPAIERILADDDTAIENAAEIELFKKLLALCEYLPEDEKATFMSSQIRMQMEFIISKMSGVPGLLKTAQSLKKSGFLDEAVESETAEDKPFKVTNHELRKVFKFMKKLSDGLNDDYLADAMCNKIDAILEQIELAENSIQIF